MDATIEGRREAQYRKHSNLEAKQALFGWRTAVERREELHCRLEHSRLRLVVGHALPNDR
jgi:hypothetical protein